MHAPKNEAREYVKQKLTELKETNKPTTEVGDCNIPFLIIDRRNRKSARIQDSIISIHLTNRI